VEAVGVKLLLIDDFDSLRSGLFQLRAHNSGRTAPGATTRYHSARSAAGEPPSQKVPKPSSRQVPPQPGRWSPQHRECPSTDL